MVQQEEPGPQGRGQAMDREVSEFEKIKALIWKDLTIRIKRRPIGYSIMTVLLIAVVWIIPIIYFSTNGHSAWDVKKYDNPPQITGHFEQTLHSAMWTPQESYGFQMDIGVKSANLGSLTNKFDKCLKQNNWWMTIFHGSGMKIRLQNEDKLEVITISANDEPLTTNWEHDAKTMRQPYCWSLDENENLQNNMTQPTMYNPFVFRDFGKEMFRLPKDAMFAQIISTCVHGSEFF